MQNQLNIIYFAWVRERLGRDEDRIEHPGAECTVSELIEKMHERDAVYEHVFSDMDKLRFALDQDFVTLETSIGSAKELAIFPPVTGG